MALQETSGPVRNPLEKDCFGKRFRHVQTGFPQDVGHFPKMEVSCVVQGSQALLAYHWARQASLSWFQTVWTTMDLNWFQDRREKSMKLYQFTLESVRIKHLQWSSAFISKFLVALPPFLKLSMSARPRSRPMRCTRFLPYFVVRHWSCYGCHRKASLSQCRERHMALPDIFFSNRDLCPTKAIWSEGVSKWVCLKMG